MDELHKEFNSEFNGEPNGILHNELKIPPTNNHDSNSNINDSEIREGISEEILSTRIDLEIKHDGAWTNTIEEYIRPPDT